MRRSIWRRLRWRRIFALLAIVGAVWAGLYWGCSGCADEPESAAPTDSFKLSARDLALSETMGLRLDSLMHSPTRLDTTQIALTVYDLTARRPVYTWRGAELLPPASCMKLPTAIAAVRMLGLGHKYYSSLQVRGQMLGDTLVGNLLLRADDDPLLEDFGPLAAKLRQRGVRHIRGNIYLRLARRDTLRPHPTAKLWDIPYYRTPPLLRGERFVRRQLLYTLAQKGITFRRDATIRPTDRYRLVATESHRMADVLAPMLIHSSNIKADATLYHIDWRAGLARSGRQEWRAPHAVEEYWRHALAGRADLLEGTVWNDGSGLSPDNRLSADLLVEIVRYAWLDKPLRRFLLDEALATPGPGGRSGSLLTRMARREYVGRVYVKTGTLTTIGGSSLAGYIHGHDGHWYAFAVINTESPVAESRLFQDRICRLMAVGK